MEKLSFFLKNQINELKQNDLFYSMPVFSSKADSNMLLNGKKVLMLSSNNYLGFAGSQRLRIAAINAINKWGIGSGAVRQIAGTMQIHVELEKSISGFKQSENSLVFNSGIAANWGTVQALMKEKDVIISDELNHGSIIDGIRMAKSEKKIFSHKNMDSLKKLLLESKNAEKILIVTDGVFSMDGDIALLKEICELAEKFGAFVMVDDAHGDGVLGKNGKGTIDYCNVVGRVAIETGTLSKAFGCVGGFVCGSNELKDFLANNARSFIFTASLPPAISGAAIESIKMIQDEPIHLNNLWKNTKYFKENLVQMGFDIGSSETPIIPVIVGKNSVAQELSKQLLVKGVFVKPIVFPLVPKDKARVRCIVNTHHSMAGLNMALDAFKAVGKRLKLIN